jgi:hypothetical protein
MTLNDLKKKIDSLVNEGHGNKDLRMDLEPEEMFDIQFIKNCVLDDDDGTEFVGVRTN